MNTFTSPAQRTRSAATQGCRHAQWKLGSAHFEGFEAPRDLKHAFHWLSAASSQGHMAAMKDLGNLIAKQILPVDPTLPTPTSLWHQAAQKGCAESMFLSADDILNRQGYALGSHAAIPLLERAQVVSHTRSACTLAYIKAAQALPPLEPLEMLPRLQFLMARGNHLAEFAIALLALFPLSGHVHMHVHELLENGASKNHPEALFYKGLLLLEGLEHDPRPEEGAQALQKAADLGLADAQFMVGWNHMAGFHTRVDFQQAELHFRRAAAQNHPRAKTELARLCLALYPASQQPVDWLLESSQAGWSEADAILTRLIAREIHEGNPLSVAHTQVLRTAAERGFYSAIVLFWSAISMGLIPGEESHIPFWEQMAFEALPFQDYTLEDCQKQIFELEAQRPLEFFDLYSVDPWQGESTHDDEPNVISLNVRRGRKTPRNTNPHDSIGFGSLLDERWRFTWVPAEAQAEDET